MDSPRDLERKDIQAEIQEAAEREHQSRRERSHAARDFMVGVERPINDLGDTLFTGNMRPPRDLLSEQTGYSREWIYLRTKHAGYETGRINASIDVQRDEPGLASNRTWLHDMLITPLYREQGYDDVLLQEVELHARRFGSTEVYYALGADDHGKLPPYLERNGYSLRSGGPSGKEAYKPLMPLKRVDDEH